MTTGRGSTLLRLGVVPYCQGAARRFSPRVLQRIEPGVCEKSVGRQSYLPLRDKFRDELKSVGMAL